MNVTWVKLTLEEARGFTTAYVLTYETLDSRRRNEVIEEIIQPEDSNKVVGGLGFATSYLIRVSASTIAGQGISSPAITVHGKYWNVILFCCNNLCYTAPRNSVFQLRMKGIPSCFEWTVSITM